MERTTVELFTRLKTANPEFNRLARRRREIDRQMVRYDRIYYLTSEQERKMTVLREQSAVLKDAMSRIMRQHVDGKDR